MSIKFTWNGVKGRGRINGRELVASIVTVCLVTNSHFDAVRDHPLQTYS